MRDADTCTRLLSEADDAVSLAFKKSEIPRLPLSRFQHGHRFFADRHGRPVEMGQGALDAAVPDLADDRRDPGVPRGRDALRDTLRA